MKLETNKIYKYAEPVEQDDEIEYIYFICITKNKDYYALNEIEKYSQMNGMGDSFAQIEDVDEYYMDVPVLDNKYFKMVNSLEAIYYIRKHVKSSQPVKQKGQFNLI